MESESVEIKWHKGFLVTDEKWLMSLATVLYVKTMGELPHFFLLALPQEVLGGVEIARMLSRKLADLLHPNFIVFHCTYSSCPASL